MSKPRKSGQPKRIPGSKRIVARLPEPTADRDVPRTMTFTMVPSGTRSRAPTAGSVFTADTLRGVPKECGPLISAATDKPITHLERLKWWALGLLHRWGLRKPKGFQIIGYKRCP